MNGRRRARTSYPRLREALATPFSRYSTEELEELFADSGIDAAELEEFFQNIAQLGGQIAQGVQRFAPQIQQFVQSPQFQAGVQGAIRGGQTGMLAGPQGAAIGAGVGFLASLLGAGAQGPGAAPAPAGPVPVQAPPPGMQLPAPAPVPVVSPQAAGQAPAAAQLLALLGQPQVMQALMAMLLGRAGAQTVSVAGAPVPVPAIPAAVGVAANAAQAEHALLAGDAESELVDAARVLQLFAQQEAAGGVAPRRRTARVHRVEEPVELVPAVEYEPVY